MRLILLGILALPMACKQAGPTIIDDEIEAETEQTAPKSSQPAESPIEVDGPPAFPPVPILDDGTHLHPPLLPPGMKQDPNSNDLVSIFRRGCQPCHGEFGEGAKEGVPNYVDYPQGLNNEIDPMIKNVLKGHGGAPSIAGKLKPRTIYHLIEFMRGRVGQKRAFKEIQQMNPSNAPGTKANNQGNSTGTKANDQGKSP